MNITDFNFIYLYLFIPAAIFAMVAQIQVNSSFKKYSKVANRKGLTGAAAAMRVLQYYNVTDVNITAIQGNLTDNYSPKDKMINLSSGVCNSSSVAAVGVACHEAGHAAQHAEGYFPLKIRNAIIPVCNIGSKLGLPLVIIGFFLSFKELIYIGLVLYALVALFQLVTLPVEFNASHRALKVIDETDMLEDDEKGGAAKVLTAAAMTYVAALATAVASLLRVLILAGGRRN